MGIEITAADLELDSKTNLPISKPSRGGITITQKDLDTASEIAPRGLDPYDSINFTNIYTDDLSKYKKYNVPTTRYFNWDDQRAKNQGTGEKWTSGITKAAVTTVGAVAENTLGVIFGIGEMAFGSGYYYDNFIGHTIDKANDWMRETMPNYRTQAEMDMTTGQKLGTANFWADTVLNGVGYSIGSLATFYLTGGTGLIMRGASVLGLAAKAKRAKNIYDISKSITTGTQLADKAFKASKMRSLLKGANMAEMGLYMSVAEASVEARETQRMAYEELLELEKERSGTVSLEAHKDILEASYSAGNTDFLVQLPVLAGTNLFMFGKQILGFKSVLGLNRDVAFKAATKTVIDKTAGKGLFRTGLARLEPFARGSVTEAIQEGWQFASKVGAIDYHTDKYFNGGSEDMIQSLYQGLEETFGTQEGLESMLVGALVGGGVSGVTSIVQKPYAQRQKNAKYLTDLLNGGYLRNAANKGKTSNMMTLALIQMEKAREAGDIKSYKDAQNKLIMYNAFEAMETGGFDVFMEKLDDAASLSDEEFAKAFGYEVNKSIEEQTGKTKQQIVDSAKQKYTTFKETYDQVTEAYPPADRKTGLPRMRMTEEERNTEEAIYNRKEGLRAQLILGLANIKDRNRRLKSIQSNMQGLLNQTVNLVNGVPIIAGEFSIFNMPAIEADPTKYDATKENKKVQARLNEILTKLRAENADPLLISEFLKHGQDYLAILGENQSAVEYYSKLSSDQYFQEIFEQERKSNEAKAKAKAKATKDKKRVDKAETTDDLKNDVKDAEGETKVTAEAKHQELKRKEQEIRNEYLALNKGTSPESQLSLLKKIDTSELSPTKLKGLNMAIKALEDQIKSNEDGVGEENPDIVDMEETPIEAVEEENIEDKPSKRVVITDSSQLEIFDDVNVETNETLILGLELAEDPSIWVGDKKVGVDEDGNIVGLEGDTIDGKSIIINQDLLLGDVKGTEVEFVIIENDWFKENHKGKPTEIEQMPIYVKIGNEYIGKLKAVKSQERQILVDKLRAGEKVTTRISEVIANNYNNAVLFEASSTSYFSNIEEVMGSGTTDNVLLAFTAGTPGEAEIVQWEVPHVSEDKNQTDLPKIQREVQRVQTEGRLDQVAVVARPENVPGGKARIFITSTANLSLVAKNKVLDLISNKDYDAAATIVAASIQKRGNNNPSFLEFSVFENGDKYLVYYSPKLQKLVRINETEMIKALNGQKASFNTVVISEDAYAPTAKHNTEDLKMDLKEDFSTFLDNKKYHVDKGLANSTDPYTSPVNPQNTYDNYQQYLFSPSEVGDRIEGDGHYSILSVDAVKLGESLFNNPKVTFERGDIMGKTAQEVIEESKIEKPTAAPVAPIQQEGIAPQNFKDKFNKPNCK